MHTTVYAAVYIAGTWPVHGHGHCP